MKVSERCRWRIYSSEASRADHGAASRR